MHICAVQQPYLVVVLVVSSASRASSTAIASLVTVALQTGA
jgi:hypothetical protein